MPDTEPLSPSFQAPGFWSNVVGVQPCPWDETNTIDKMQARVEYDLEYLRNWSLGLDLQIIVRTIRLVLFDRNAY